MKKFLLALLSVFVISCAGHAVKNEPVELKAEYYVSYYDKSNDTLNTVKTPVKQDFKRTVYAESEGVDVIWLWIDSINGAVAYHVIWKDSDYCGIVITGVELVEEYLEGDMKKDYGRAVPMDCMILDKELNLQIERGPVPASQEPKHNA